MQLVWLLTIGKDFKRENNMLYYQPHSMDAAFVILLNSLSKQLFVYENF